MLCYAIVPIRPKTRGRTPTPAPSLTTASTPVLQRSDLVVRARREREAGREDEATGRDGRSAKKRKPKCAGSSEDDPAGRRGESRAGGRAGLGGRRGRKEKTDVDVVAGPLCERRGSWRHVSGVSKCVECVEGRKGNRKMFR